MTVTLAAACPMVNDCVGPLTAPEVAPAVALAVRVQLPTPTQVTTPPTTLQVLRVLEIIVSVPSPV